MTHVRNLIAVILIAMTWACSTAEAEEPVPFLDYQRDVLNHVRAGRISDARNLEAEVALNGPREWWPAKSGRGTKPEKGILLVHGLGDSPWTFNDVAQEFVKHGFLVRTILLPGHGTHPNDMLDVELEQWQKVVQEQAATLKQDVEQVYLGGFSTGANLVTEYAYENDDIAGLVLFSPAFKSSTRFDWMTPLISWVRPWLLSPEGGRPLQNAVRYFMVPTNGFAQFYRSSVAVRRALKKRPYKKPVFMVVSQHDSVLDADYLLDVFENRFTNPASRLIWYGTIPARVSDTERVIVRTDQLPSHRISQFSHMGILFSPENSLYGEHGSLRICWNGQEEAATEACSGRATVWYSDWGYRERGKIHARLTFNPYFQWQNSVMLWVIDGDGSTTSSKSVPSPSHPAESVQIQGTSVH
ncbi:alpha/beta hydrolase [Rhizobium aegyptiacum]|uniref:alpha/beta hydrolase n=1 Tax=Rhizobium aegyptiacum TaxID=1764550 RepID=UPI0007E55E95|nr:alpha/beta fold hydrolase [Rhizobium aegyptiacum]